MLALLFFSFLFIYGFFQYLTVRKLPNGPLPFLFFGNLPQLYWYCYKKGDFAKALREIQKRHGDVHTLWLGSMPFVNICTLEKAKELMVNQGHTQLGRYVAPFIRINQIDATGKAWGIVASTGETWTEHRRFALQTLRNFGMGRNIMEGRIIEEMDYQLGDLEETMVKGKMEVTASHLTDLIVGSIINRILFGYRFDKPRREYFFGIKQKMDNMIDKMTPMDVLMQPWWKHVPILKWRYEQIVSCIDPVLQFVKQNVQRRVDEVASGQYKLNDEPEDYMDAYMMEQKKRGDNVGELTTHGLVIDLHDLWLAGQETTTITLQWALHLLLEHPAVMKRCQQEVLAATGGSRNLSFADRPKTPYFTATCTEVQRLASILNFNLWRLTNAPCSIDGVDIPVGTMTTAQLSLILSDPEVFHGTDAFEPSRFLGDDGKTLAEKVIPFGIGKRSCPGESLARNEIYLILGNLLCRYNIHPSETNPPRGAAAVFSVAHAPAKFDVVLEKIESCF
ncbi:unnamed protein product, partial [Mesorhabditis belari]|uniref:Cytochrome P450 n=1 Tax=Mesorhabditis belari TaxID=2138241 RepID=A0AAF3J527_9BILA